MTIQDLEQIAADADSQTDAQRMMAGAYAAKALRALRDHDYAGARRYLIEAAHRRPEIAAALSVVDAAERGAKKSERKTAAVRANGHKGGRPRKCKEADPYDEVERNMLLGAQAERQREEARAARIAGLRAAGQWDESDELRELLRRLASAYRECYDYNPRLYAEVRAALDAKPDKAATPAPAQIVAVSPLP